MRPKAIPLVVILLGRLCIYFFILLMLTVALYLLGNFQDFLDASQIMLLRISQILSFLYILTNVYYQATVFILVRNGSRKRFFNLFMGIIGSMIVVFYLFSSKFIASWQHG